MSVYFGDPTKDARYNKSKHENFDLLSAVEYYLRSDDGEKSRYFPQVARDKDGHLYLKDWAAGKQPPSLAVLLEIYEKITETEAAETDSDLSSQIAALEKRVAALEASGGAGGSTDDDKEEEEGNDNNEEEESDRADAEPKIKSIGGASISSENGALTVSYKGARYANGFHATDNAIKEPGEYVRFNAYGAGFYGLNSLQGNTSRWNTNTACFYIFSSRSDQSIARPVASGAIVGSKNIEIPQGRKIGIAIANDAIHWQVEQTDGSYKTVFSYSKVISKSQYLWGLFGDPASKVSGLIAGKSA